MSTSGDISKSSTTECGDIGGGDNDEKMSTSYEQNLSYTRQYLRARN